MKFKLGQKVKYKRATNKKMYDYFLESKDFEGNYDEKEVIRREVIELEKVRTGYIVGRRRITFTTTSILQYNSDPLKISKIKPFQPPLEL